MGMSVDLAELGAIKVTVTSKMVDSLEEVTVANALKTPRVTFKPKASMLEAAKSVELSIDKSKVTAVTTAEETE